MTRSRRPCVGCDPGGRRQVERVRLSLVGIAAEHVSAPDSRIGRDDQLLQQILDFARKAGACLGGLIEIRTLSPQYADLLQRGDGC